ncbi:DrmB family protein [Nonomuraea indica]|uniref:DrmB family protein n=1 Tax=Nonomuraea indica TaxID=1581193 RepID=A0ABW8AG77_9ACTN
MAGDKYRVRAGAVRPSHLMFTSGVGSLVDLPNFSVLVSGLDDWRYEGAYGWEAIAEPRLLAAIQSFPYRKGEPESLNFRSVKELRPAPWIAGIEREPSGPASKVGVPAVPFPGWMRCTACDLLAPIDSKVFGFENDKPRKPHEARFFHDNCGRKRKGRKPLAVAARFVLACTGGHLDDFPYVEFVHHGQPCAKVTHPTLQMTDRGGNLGANVEVRCTNCEEKRNIRAALGRRGQDQLPRCRGRHPHLSYFDEGGCNRQLHVLVVGASNQWFPQTLAALAVPQTGAKAIDTMVERHWEAIKPLVLPMYPWARENLPIMRDHFAKWSDQEVWDATERRRAIEAGETEKKSPAYPDLRSPEWEVFSAEELPEPNDDFALRRLDEIPGRLKEIYADVLQVERLREVRALIGFTRLDAPDPEDPDLVTRAPLSRSKPLWVPASQVRGEGIFLRLPEDLLRDWEERVIESEAMRQHLEAYTRFRSYRYSDRIKGSFDAARGWPGPRFYALHTLSHLLIRTIALQCGYSSASLSERIYAGTPDDPRSGILIYTAVPDSEGTFGGLVSLAEPDRLVELTFGALRDARHCSSDPLCAERTPQAPADFLHGAACHVCLFVSETTCERGNRYLDRRFVVPLAEEPGLALFAGLL